MKQCPVPLLILEEHMYDIMRDFPAIYSQIIQRLKESKWCSAGAVNKQTKHVTDAQMTSKMPLQVPVEIFKEPDAAALYLPQLRVYPVITFQSGCVVQYAEINNTPSSQFLSLFSILSTHFACVCTQDVQVSICVYTFIYIYTCMPPVPLCSLFCAITTVRLFDRCILDLIWA